MISQEEKDFIQKQPFFYLLDLIIIIEKLSSMPTYMKNQERVLEEEESIKGGLLVDEEMEEK